MLKSCMVRCGLQCGRLSGIGVLCGAQEISKLPSGMLWEVWDMHVWGGRIGGGGNRRAGLPFYCALVIPSKVDCAIVGCIDNSYLVRGLNWIGQVITGTRRVLR